MTPPCLTIVIPTYPPHFAMATNLINSIASHAIDAASIIVRLIVEEEHRAFVTGLANVHSGLRIECETTESIFNLLGIDHDPQLFLQKSGKFSYQSIKKIGGVLGATSGWALVLDSESLFLKSFSAQELVDDYCRRRYVFFTNATQRQPGWTGSLSEAVTRNAANLVGGDPDRWFMEYYHWFYETTIWRDLISHLRATGGLARWLDHKLPRGVFENVLYYQFVASRTRYGYRFIDVAAELKSYLPANVVGRVDAAMKGRLDIVGILEYITTLVSVDEVEQLRPFFDAYRLPFLRLEPSAFDRRYIDSLACLPSVCALTSSHRLTMLEKRVAVCLSGDFRSVFSNIREIRSFTSGVNCDFFVHSWSSDTVPVIKDILQSRKLLEEVLPDMAHILGIIAQPEPELKPDRDVGSLCMFHGIQESLRLTTGMADDYSVVVRMRPDLLIQDSLRDILIRLSDNEGFPDDLVYLPDSHHSQGINDQFALGSYAAMMQYAGILDYVAKHANREYFNPEHLMACHLLDAGLNIAVLPMEYILLRHEPANIDWVGHIQKLERETWWSATLPGKRTIRRATGMVATKVRAIRDMVRRDCFHDWSLIVDTASFSPDAQALIAAGTVEIFLRRDYKNPAIDCLVEVFTEDGTQTLFVDVRSDGLHLSPHRFNGLLFAIAADQAAKCVELIRFDNDLDTPAAQATLRCAERPSLIESKPEDQSLLASEPQAISPELAALLFLPQKDEATRWQKLWARRLLHRGRALRRRGKNAAAKQLYRRSLTLDPHRPREWVQFGHIIKDAGNEQAALGAYRVALTLAPNDPDAMLHFSALANDLQH